MSLGRTLERLEKDALVALLEAHDWILRRAANSSGVSEEVIRGRMKRYGLALPKRTSPGPKRTARARRKQATRFQLVAPRTWAPVTP